MQKRTFAITTKLQSSTKQCHLILSILCLASLFLPLMLQAQTPETLDKLSAQWLSIEQQTRLLNKQWAVNQPLLIQRIELLEAELTQLNTLIKENQSTGDSVQDKRESLLAQQNELEQRQARLSPALGQIEQVLGELSEQLPPPVALAWQAIEDSRLSSDAQTPSTQSNSMAKQRDVDDNSFNQNDTNNSQPVANVKSNNTADLQEILQRLSSLNEFNQRVAVNKSTIDITSNKTIAAPPAEPQKLAVTQLYLGSSYAWFVSEDGSKTGYGQALQGHWRWQIDNSLSSADIKQAIAIYNNQQLPDYVQLPIRLSKQLPVKANQIEAISQDQATP